MRRKKMELKLKSLNFNPRTAWAMRPSWCAKRQTWRRFQSTHRVSDATACPWSISGRFEDFNPRTAWALRRKKRGYICRKNKNFNPRTAWAMRRTCRYGLSSRPYFNPRTAWAMRPAAVIVVIETPIYSIHAPRERCDHTATKHRSIRESFQSTHRVSDATKRG